jgi:glutamate dehydrogenase
MTDNVAHLVLEDNRLQALGLSIAEAGGSEALPSYVRLIETFEDSGTLDRRVEGLANNDQLLRRVQDSKGLTRPELAVLLSTAKLTLQDAIERGTLADDPSMGADLAASFPQQMQEREADAIASHQLRREIIATELANRIINRLGLIHPYEMVEEEGCSLADIASAFVVADRIFGVKALWQDIDTAEMPEKGRIELLGLIAKAMRSQMASIVRITPPGFVPGEAVAALRDGVEQLSGEVDAILTEILLARAALMEDDLELLGVPGDLAQRVSMLFKMDGALGLANLNQKLGGDMLETARAFVRLGDATGVHWLQTALAKLDPSDPWERQLLSGIERDTQQMRLDLLGRLGTKNALENVEAWLGKHKPRIDQFLHQFERAKAAPAPHVAMLAELTGQARGLMSR